jgi:hypothetical protein
MPKTPKTALKQMNIPFEVHTSGDPWQLSGEIPATVPLPNDVIITEIEGAYTERDRKLWAFLIASVWDDLLTVRIHEVRAAKIKAIFHELGGTTSSSWIWESAKRLLNTRVTWEEGSDAERLEGCASLLASAITNKNARAAGFLRFEISTALCAVIRAPCRFSRLRLHFMIGLSGKYAVTLYMILESVANKQTPVLDVTLDQLRQWLKVPEGKLNRWVDIKRRAVEPALKQINDSPEAAGFTVSMEEIKEGRAVDRVRFILTKTAGRLTDEKALKQVEKIEVTPTTRAANSSGALHLPTTAYEQAKKAAPGLDVYGLENTWREWMADKPRPDNPAGAFVGFCRDKYKKEKGKGGIS